MEKEIKEEKKEKENKNTKTKVEKQSINEETKKASKTSKNTSKSDVIEESTTVEDVTTKIVKDNDKVIEKNAEFNLLEVIIIVLITGIVVSLLSGIIVYNNYAKINDNANKTNNVSNSDLKEFIENYSLILNEYVDDVDKKELLDAAISGMYNFLGDDYSTYLDKDYTDTLEDQLTGEYRGIGVEIGTYTMSDETIIVITDIFKDSPAEKARLKVDDVLIKLDDIDLKDKDGSFVSDYIKNGDKNEFTLIVKREDKEVSVKLNRGHVYIDSVDYKVDGNVGYIQIETFSETTSEQVKKAIDSFPKKVKSVIIDVRDNTGGTLNAAYNTSDIFIEKGKNIYQIKDKNGIISSFKAQKGVYRKFDKIVVLVNGNSASASEILALALKESAGAKIVGVKSFGKGTVQATSMLESGAMVKYTTSYWLSPNGNSINKEGIIPDIEEKEIDKQYIKAIEVVK